MSAGFPMVGPDAVRQRGSEKAREKRMSVPDLPPGWERHIETVAGGLYGIAGDLVGLGAEIPPPLRAELPPASVPALASGTIGRLSR